MEERSCRARTGVLWATVLALLVPLTGCVERRMTIRTNLDDQGGALAIIDNTEVGVTPVSTGFTYYAAREVRLIKDGYETATFIQPVPTPWWDVFPLDFFVENLVPFTIRDEREYLYELSPTVQVPTDELLLRAHQLRTEGKFSAEILPNGQPIVPADGVNF